MDVSTIVNIVLSVLSFVLAAISVVTVVITLRQNHQMIENSTRPYVCIYGESINPGSPLFYLVVKNFGSSPATITKFEYSPDLHECYGMNSAHRDYLQDLSRSTLAPGQSRICKLDYSKINEPIHFSLEYVSGKKKYSEQFVADIKSGSTMLTGKIATDGKELRTISFTLQELLQKSL